MSKENFNKIQNWLKDKLAYGPCLASDILKEAKESGINSSGKNSILYKVKEHIRVKSVQSFNKEWWWIDPDVKLEGELKHAWITTNLEWLNKNIKNLDDFFNIDELKFFDDIESEEEKFILVKTNKENGATVVVEHHTNPYEWLENNHIYRKQ